MEAAKDAIGVYAQKSIYGTDVTAKDVLLRVLRKRESRMLEVSDISLQGQPRGSRQRGNLIFFTFDLGDGNNTIYANGYSSRINFKLKKGLAETESNVQINTYWNTDVMKEQLQTNIFDEVTEATVKGDNTALTDMTKPVKLPIKLPYNNVPNKKRTCDPQVGAR